MGPLYRIWSTKLLISIGCNDDLTTPQLPASKGQAEHFARTLKTIVRATSPIDFPKTLSGGKYLLVERVLQRFKCICWRFPRTPVQHFLCEHLQTPTLLKQSFSTRGNESTASFLGGSYPAYLSCGIGRTAWCNIVVGTPRDAKATCSG